jgi:hypothetical protein
VSLLFSEGHFPGIDSEDEATRQALADLIKETMLNEIMIDAATRGSVGSVCILLRVLKCRIFFKVMETQFLTPTWKPDAPDELQKVREQYKVKGEDLVKQGYTGVENDGTEYWFAREWDETAETWFVPWKVKSDDGKPVTPQIDKATDRTTQHNLGFVPMVWVKNLPGGDDIDGKCTFEIAVPTVMEIDYLLSQGGRGLKYASDPTLVIQDEGQNAGQSRTGGAANALVVPPSGDAKLLEINGTAASALVEYVRALRELALESMHGNRANADKISAAQSGRAMELMADKLRISYGEAALLKLLRMVVAANQKMEIKVAGKAIKLSQDKPLALKWPRWYAPTADDRLNDANTLSVLTTANILSRESATEVVAETYDIEDTAAETSRIESEAKADADAEVNKATAMAATVKPVP